MKRIPLTKGQFALVDDEDFCVLSKYRWHAHYCRHSKAYKARRIDRGSGRGVYMHRQITHASKNKVVDHADHNGLNNQRGNLRVCSLSENARNSIVRKDNTSGFKGVVWHRSSSKWMARIWFSGKRHTIGSFNDVTEAANAYDSVAIEKHGEFALTNKKLGLFRKRTS